MFSEKGSIKYFLIVIVIAILVFLSQQSYFAQIGKNLFSGVSGVTSGYWAKGAKWVNDTIFSKINKEVQNRGEVISNELDSKKQKVSEDIGKKIINYFSGITNSVINPGNNTCETSNGSVSNTSQ